MTINKLYHVYGVKISKLQFVILLKSIPDHPWAKSFINSKINIDKFIQYLKDMDEDKEDENEDFGDDKAVDFCCGFAYDLDEYMGLKVYQLPHDIEEETLIIGVLIKTSKVGGCSIETESPFNFHEKNTCNF